MRKPDPRCTDPPRFHFTSVGRSNRHQIIDAVDNFFSFQCGVDGRLLWGFRFPHASIDVCYRDAASDTGRPISRVSLTLDDDTIGLTCKRFCIERATERIVLDPYVSSFSTHLYGWIMRHTLIHRIGRSRVDAVHRIVGTFYRTDERDLQTKLPLRNTLDDAETVGLKYVVTNPPYDAKVNAVLETQLLLHMKRLRVAILVPCNLSFYRRHMRHVVACSVKTSPRDALPVLLWSTRDECMDWERTALYVNRFSCESKDGTRMDERTVAVPTEVRMNPPRVDVSVEARQQAIQSFTSTIVARCAYYRAQFIHAITSGRSDNRTVRERNMRLAIGVFALPLLPDGDTLRIPDAIEAVRRSSQLAVLESLLFEKCYHLAREPRCAHAQTTLRYLQLPRAIDDSFPQWNDAVWALATFVETGMLADAEQAIDLDAALFDAVWMAFTDDMGGRRPHGASTKRARPSRTA